MKDDLLEPNWFTARNVNVSAQSQREFMTTRVVTLCAASTYFTLPALKLFWFVAGRPRR
jgi:hypothetical protein